GPGLSANRRRAARCHPRRSTPSAARSAGRRAPRSSPPAAGGCRRTPRPRSSSPSVVPAVPRSPAARAAARHPAAPRRARVWEGMSEPPPDLHEFVTFDAPDEHRTYAFDVTFLTSPWRCIYGQGCQGVLTGPAPELERGCCSYGAHFVDE